MELDRLHSIKNINVLIFGDLMVDKYILGDVKRISPEAPVPIVEVLSKTSKLGGAGNVINNVIALGATAKVIGCVGDDADGLWIKTQLTSIGVDTTFLQLNQELLTISKTRIASRNQQFLRYDEEIVKDIPTSYDDFIKENIENVFKDINVIIISDYNKGAVTKTLAQFIIKYANNIGIPVVVDPKGKDYSKYYGATVCTPNVNELSVVTDKTISSEEDILDCSKEICEKIDLNYLMLTRSEKGISLFKNGDGIKKDFPAIIKDVIDVTGAGDTVVSCVAVLIAAGFSYEDCCIIANMAASIVCSKFGASTLSLNELLSFVVDTGEFKFIDLKTAKYVTAALHEKGKKVVFTNGCFDLLHAGHLSSFTKAKSFGDILIVAVNSDSSVKKIKGNKRPIIKEKDRIAMLCALECVNYVVLMEDLSPINIINTIKPDISVKGKDWENKEIPEKSVVESYGGHMEFIDLQKGLSTTNIIDAILKE